MILIHSPLVDKLLTRADDQERAAAVAIVTTRPVITIRILVLVFMSNSSKQIISLDGLLGIGVVITRRNGAMPGGIVLGLPIHLAAYVAGL